ncbi:Aste57867_19604 [Aphanomyces stellatus]|uniref:Aste57867_19604 protein n=1 Tax=Aphanomyces stellatus TaxID=120398 RepID=A0A485LE70_9STRA|nr:hypothetical protein As57867_019540 [Aphanomyces stellatus]VFT96305.1 Aste57867_19604 [Aphanomyces stellatus]
MKTTTLAVLLFVSAVALGADIPTSNGGTLQQVAADAKESQYLRAGQEAMTDAQKKEWGLWRGGLGWGVGCGGFGCGGLGCPWLGCGGLGWGGCW